MEFRFEKWSGKIERTEGIELRNQESFKTLRAKENYKYVRILRGDTFKQTQMEEKNKKGVP